MEQPHVLTGNALVGGVGGKPVQHIKPEPKPETKPVDTRITAEQEIRKLLEERQARVDKLNGEVSILRDLIQEHEVQIEDLERERDTEQVQVDAFQRVLVELRAATIAANDTGTKPVTASIKPHPGPQKEVPETVRQGLIENDYTQRTTYKAPPKKHSKRRRVSPFRATEPGTLELAIMLLEDAQKPLSIADVADGIGMSRRDKRGKHSLGSLLLLETKKSNPRIIRPELGRYAIAPKAGDEKAKA